MSQNSNRTFGETELRALVFAMSFAFSFAMLQVSADGGRSASSGSVTEISVEDPGGRKHHLTFKKEPSSQQINSIEKQKDTTLLFYIGRYYEQESQLNVAASYYRKALDLNSRKSDVDKTIYVRSAETLGYIYAMQHHYLESVDYFSKAIKARPLNTRDFDNRASAYQQLGNEAAAKKDIEIAKRLKKQPPPNDYYQKTRFIFGVGGASSGQPGERARSSMDP